MRAVFGGQPPVRTRARRHDSYRRALESVVRPGMRVLDVGTGSGILAMFAARSGAEVVAVDSSSILEMARCIAHDNGLSERIDFLRGPIEELDPGAPVDLIVSEWMGFFALAECMFRSVIHARDRHLAPGGRMMPSRLELCIAAVEDSVLHVEHGIGLWERPIFGLDFRTMVDHELGSLITTAVNLRPAALLGPAAPVLELDLGSATVEDFFFDASVRLPVERSGHLHGFGGWFAVELAPGIRLSTGPYDPPTHWRQSFFPVRPFSVKAGDILDLRMKAEAKEYGDRRLPLYFLETTLLREGEELHRCFYRHEASFE